MTSYHSAGLPNESAPDARTEMGRAILEVQVPPAILDGLRTQGPFGLIVIAPSDDHASIIVSGLEAMVEDPTYVLQIDAPSQGIAEDLVQGLARKGITVAVATSLDCVPATFAALADHIIHVEPHDVKTLRRTMRAVLQTTVPPFPKTFVLHPNPSVLCRCIATGLSPRRVVQAVTRLGKHRTVQDVERLPVLEEAVEYGEAREWGLQLKADLTAWRSGTLPASELEAGCLLAGPPGTGKTLYAKVLAKSLAVPLIATTIGESYAGQGHLGEVITELRHKFAEAASVAPSVLFIDEIDSVANRDHSDRNSSFVVGLVNELLALVEVTMRRHPGLIVIGATNRPHAIDPALLRPGRLGRTIALGMPGPSGIESILRFHLDRDLKRQDLRGVVRFAMGLSPAMLMDAVRTARRSARAEARPLEIGDLKTALLGGDEDWELLRRVAVHESGHAMACLLVPDAPILRSVSLIDRGGMLGNVLVAEPEGAVTRCRMEARIMMALAGRAAEAIVFGDDPSDGAQADLQMATTLASEMHSHLGMGDSLLHRDHRERLVHDERFAVLIDDHLKRLLADITAILADFYQHLLALAFELCRCRVISGLEACEIVRSVDLALASDLEVLVQTEPLPGAA